MSSLRNNQQSISCFGLSKSSFGTSFIQKMSVLHHTSPQRLGHLDDFTDSLACHNLHSCCQQLTVNSTSTTDKSNFLWLVIKYSDALCTLFQVSRLYRPQSSLSPSVTFTALFFLQNCSLFFFRNSFHLVTLPYSPDLKSTKPQLCSPVRLLL